MATPGQPEHPEPALNNKKTGLGILDWIERIGNKLPDPVTLFMIGALLVLIGSELAVRFGWQAAHPTQPGVIVEARSLLRPEGLQWVWDTMVTNFTGFRPLGVVLVAMLGIGVAERAGLLGALLKLAVLATPAALLTPAVIFVGVMSSAAVDAGYVVLPPLAAAVFAKAGRAPLVGLAAVFAGVGAGFSANLLITALDPLLMGLTEEAAQLLNPDYTMRPDCNYYFMIVSTIFITLIGWGVTKWIVEKRFSQADIDEQVRTGMASMGGGASGGGGDHVTDLEVRGMLAALGAFIVCSALVLALVLVPGWALHAEGTKEDPAKWPDAIVPILFVLFLIPGIAFGAAAGTVKNDRDVARMFGESMSTMGPYVVLAFFAGQFVAWFGQSNLGFLIAVEGVTFLRQFNLSSALLVIAIIMLTCTLNLFIGSASAKWALIAPVMVPLFMGLGLSPELTQAAYRVGDSVTNTIAPLNPYIVVMLVFMAQWKKDAGLGSIVSLMLPYSLTFGILWTCLLLAWMAFGAPLGPGGEPMFIEPLGAGG